MTSNTNIPLQKNEAHPELVQTTSMDIYFTEIDKEIARAYDVAVLARKLCLARREPATRGRAAPAEKNSRKLKNDDNDATKKRRGSAPRHYLEPKGDPSDIPRVEEREKLVDLVCGDHDISSASSRRSPKSSNASSAKCFPMT